MKPIVAILIAVALLIVGVMIGAALVGGVVVSRFAALPSPAQEVYVVVARQPLNQWSTIRDPRAVFDIETMPVAAAPANYIPADQLDGLQGVRLKASVAKGACLTQDDLLSKEVTGVQIPPGKRAVSVKINADKRVSFFVVPGCRVDVVHTVEGVSKILAEDVLVLAIDVQTAAPEDKVGAVGDTATLQVNPDQVLKLTAASEKGSITLVMRPMDEDPKKP